MRETNRGLIIIIISLWMCWYSIRRQTVVNERDRGECDELDDDDAWLLDDEDDDGLYYCCCLWACGYMLCCWYVGFSQYDEMRWDEMEERKSERRERHCCFIQPHHHHHHHIDFCIKGNHSIWVCMIVFVFVCIMVCEWVRMSEQSDVWLCRWWFVMYLLCVSCVVLPTWSGHALLWWDEMIIIIVIVVAVSLPSRQNNSRICREGSALTVLVCECVYVMVCVCVCTSECYRDCDRDLDGVRVDMSLCMCDRVDLCVMCVWSCHHAWLGDHHIHFSKIHTHTPHSTRDTCTYGSLYNGVMIMNTKHITCLYTACTAAQCAAQRSDASRHTTKQQPHALHYRSQYNISETAYYIL